MLTDHQKKCFVALLWDYLEKDPEHKDRVNTGWGTKTEVGLLAVIDRIANTE